MDLILAYGTGGVQSEGSTPLCLVLVTSLPLLSFMSVCFQSLSAPSHTHTHTAADMCVSLTHTFFVCGKASSRPRGTVCEWLGLLWHSHTTPAVL